jgi:Concanavalin A-like lectin/glucanases superfamily/PEP-CTERM motif
MYLSLERGYLCILVVLTSMTCQQSLAALTGEYKFEGTAADTSGFGRDGTLGGGPTFTGGLYPGSTSALLMSGAQTVELPAGSDFIRNAPGATLMAWIRPDDLSATRNIMVVDNGGAGIGAARALLEFNGGAFRAIGRRADSGSSTIISGGSPAVGQTYFVAGVFDYVNGDMFLYVNGQPAASNTNITSWTSNSADTANAVARIGSHADGTQQFWFGAIDGARIFNTALTPEQVLNLYEHPDMIPGEPIIGDTDGDGVVELEDLDPIRMNWRQTGKTLPEGNLSGDTAGLVDFRDFRIWKTAYLNQGSGSLANVDLSFLGEVVPEPSAVCLFLMGGSIGLTWRGARKSAAPRLTSMME